MKLICDLGGTKVLLALVDQKGEIVQERRFTSSGYSDFDSLVGGYLESVDVAIDGGCLAVAGTISDDGCFAKITNLPWMVDVESLNSRFGIGRMHR